MDSQSIIGKRKKKRKECPNPLFVHWLKEWTDDAAAKGMKSQYTYRKALNALVKYPLPLESGKACKVLECFGDKICKMLDDKLDNYVAEYGTTEPIPGVIDVPQSKPKPKKAKGNKENSYQDINAATHRTYEVDFSSDEEQNNAKERRKSGNKNRQKSGPKEYIPKYRTGGYAIILALHNNEQQPGYAGYMTKKTLMDEAQPFAAESFRIPEPGCRYTAWSMMGTLRKKGFVHSYSNPAKFTLTYAGRDLGLKIKSQEASGVLPDAQLNRNAAKPALPSVALSDDEMDSDIEEGNEDRLHEKVTDNGSSSPCRSLSERLGFSNSANPLYTAGTSNSSPLRETENISRDFGSSVPEGNARFRFWYVAEDGSEHVYKDKAQVTIDDDIGVGFLIKCKYGDLLTSGKKYTLDCSRGGSGDYIYAFLADSDADNIAISPLSNVGTVQKPNVPKHHVSQRLQKSTVAVNPTENPAENLPSSSTTTSVRSWPKAFERQTSVADSQESTCSTTSAALSYQSLPDPDFILKPGTFEVILCVDMQEKASKMAQQVLQPELKKHGIQFQLRKLQVGDFLWIARPKFSGQAFGRENVPVEERELVLDYIVERKRMDDLASSIMDGRFMEQKFRLRSCGLKQAIYLVEDYGSAQHYSISEDALNQAIANTQVVDEFYVRRTKDLRDSIAYLTIMTRYLQSVYSSKTLVACKASSLNESGVTNHMDSHEQYLMTYKEFSSKTTKNKPLTVKEMFLKQLVQISGLTVEKACAITDSYPTPRMLMDSLEMCDNQTERDNLLETMKAGSGKRNLGKQLAQLLAKLYTTKTPLT